MKHVKQANLDWLCSHMTVISLERQHAIRCMVPCETSSAFFVFRKPLVCVCVCVCVCCVCVVCVCVCVKSSRWELRKCKALSEFERSASGDDKTTYVSFVWEQSMFCQHSRVFYRRSCLALFSRNGIQAATSGWVSRLPRRHVDYACSFRWEHYPFSLSLQLHANSSRYTVFLLKLVDRNMHAVYPSE